MILLSILKIVFIGTTLIIAVYTYAMFVAKFAYISMRPGVPRGFVQQYLENVMAEGDSPEVEKVTRILELNTGRERVPLPKESYHISVNVGKRKGSLLPILVVKQIAISKKGSKAMDRKWMDWQMSKS